MAQHDAKKPKLPTFLSKIRSKLSRGPPPQIVKKKLPRRAFNIGARVVNLNEVGTDGRPTGDLRYVRDSQYSEPQKGWLYQLNGKNYKNNAGWVAEEALRRYPEQAEGMSVGENARITIGR